MMIHTWRSLLSFLSLTRHSQAHMDFAKALGYFAVRTLIAHDVPPLRDGVFKILVVLLIFATN